jgi:pyruvate dehydrogenase E1 component alpha subunit
VADAFEAGKIRAPIHLSGGNEDQLIDIFREIKREDWVFSTWRNHYHALLHGVPRELVMSEIMAGRSMMLHFPEYRFFTSAIVGGILPIACGVAAAIAKDHPPFTNIRRCHCFVGDMTASLGAFRDAQRYAVGHRLPIRFIVEDNGLSTNTPTRIVWGTEARYAPDSHMASYKYQRTYPHVGSGKYVAF